MKELTLKIDEMELDNLIHFHAVSIANGHRSIENTERLHDLNKRYHRLMEKSEEKPAAAEKQKNEPSPAPVTPNTPWGNKNG